MQAHLYQLAAMQQQTRHCNINSLNQHNIQCILQFVLVVDGIKIVNITEYGINQNKSETSALQY